MFVETEKYGIFVCLLIIFNRHENKTFTLIFYLRFVPGIFYGAIQSFRDTAFS